MLQNINVGITHRLFGWGYLLAWPHGIWECWKNKGCYWRENQGCHHHSSGICSPMSALLFQQHFWWITLLQWLCCFLARSGPHLPHPQKCGDILSQNLYPSRDNPVGLSWHNGSAQLFGSCAVSPLNFSLDKSACFTPRPLPRGCHGLQPYKFFPWFWIIQTPPEHWYRQG